jgi:trehalose-6-phosphate synthase
LTDALIINPYDVQRTGEAIAEALEMDTAQITDRMRRIVREHNIYWWAASLIGVLCDLRIDRE